MKKIKLDFENFSLEGEIFETAIGKKFYHNLPQTVELVSWGNEVYGPLSVNLGEENPQPAIPAGGLAYSTMGNYLCIFFGQSPAWPVEYLGQINGDSWQKLKKASLTRVTVTSA